MAMTTVRADIEKALHIIASEQIPEPVRDALQVTLTHALREVEQGPEWLTTAEAAALLGVKSINTVKAWCKTGYIRGVRVGGRVKIPRSEVERIRDSDRVRAVQASDRLHEASSELGAGGGLTPEQLRDLSAARPGTLPWQREEQARSP
jgi:excisionase family DNA binding protein